MSAEPPVAHRQRAHRVRVGWGVRGVEVVAVLGGPASGRELIADGFDADVDLAAELDVGTVVPHMRDGFLRA